MDQATQALNQRKQLLLLSIDLQGAFDTTDNDLIWSKLQKTRIPQYLLRLIDQFLSNRSAELTIQTETHLTQLTRGVPQGSPLSPTLFAAYVNDLPSICRGEVKGQLFADDFVLWRMVDKDGFPNNDLRSTIRALEDCCLQNRMQCNCSKTKLLSITRLRKSHTPKLPFFGNTILPSQSLKYLGVDFDRRLTFSAHINQVEMKLAQRLSTIRKMASKLWGTNPWILGTLIRGTLIPLATYAATTWGPHILGNKSRLKQINRVLRHAAIAITGALSTSPFTEVLHLAGLETFEELIRTSLLKSAHNWEHSQLTTNQTTTTYPTRLTSTKQLFASLPEISKLSFQALSPAQWKSEAKDWTHNQIMKTFCEDPNPAKGRASLPWGPFAWRTRWVFKKFRRLDLSLLTQFLLDHWRSRKFLHRIHKQESPLCRMCNRQEESRQHILQCPHTAQLCAQRLPGITTLEALGKHLRKRPNLQSLSELLRDLHHLWEDQASR